MITKTNAVKMSIKKWEKIVAGYKGWLENDCGFCLYMNEISNLDDCSKCPLHPDVCGKHSLYGKYSGNKNPKIAKQILEAIKERGEKWLTIK